MSPPVDANKEPIIASTVRVVDVPETESDVELPADVSATYQRNFNRPSGLGGGTRVFLRIESWQGQLISLSVNDHPLEIATPPLMCEITEWLEPHNQIRLELRGVENEGARLSGEVALSIDEED